MVSELTYCDFTSDDYGLFCEWCLGHDKEPLPWEWLPAAGIIVCKNDEPIVMLWVYFDTTTPTGFLERLVVRPGLKPTDIRDACIFALHGPIKDIATYNGATVLFARCPAPIARFCERAGWVTEGRELVNLSYVLEKEELCLG